MPYTATGNSTFVDNTERVVMETVKETQPDLVRQLFTEVPWSPGDGDTVTFNAVALSGYAQRVDENENYSEVNPVDGDELTKKQVQYGDKLNITRRMEKFNRYAEARFGAEALAKRVKNILDLEMTLQVFGEADQLTFTPKGKSAVDIATADGVALASASHTVNGAAGITYSNIATSAALSMDALTAAISHGEQNTVDDFGTSLIPNFDTIVVAKNAHMSRKTREIFGSRLNPENEASGSSNAINVYTTESGWRVIELAHGMKNSLGAISTDNAYRWMIMDSEMAKMNLQYQVAETPTTEQRFQSSDNLLASILVTQFASFAAVRWQGMVYNLTTSNPS